MTNIILLLIIFLVANLPWFSNRLFYIVPLKHQPKVFGWCVLELVVFYFVMGAISFYTERSTMGQVAEQNWEFYAVTASLFIVLAFPGFVYKYFWQRS
jgi:hypothetical protein